MLNTVTSDSRQELYLFKIKFPFGTAAIMALDNFPFMNNEKVIDNVISNIFI